MITIQHTYADNVIITYLDRTNNYALKEERVDNMDDLTEHICDVLIQHGFNCADVCSASTGEVLMIIKRT